jgi:hypothetical protein
VREAWPTIDDAAVKIRFVPLKGGLRATAGTWGAGECLWRETELVASLPQAARSLARGPRGELVIGTTRGVLRLEAGLELTPANDWAQGGRAWDQPFDVSSAGEGRIWGRTEKGALFRSDDAARTWVGPLLPAAVLGAVALPGGRVLAIAPHGQGTSIHRSEDGTRWSTRQGPALRTPIAIAVLSDAVVLAGHDAAPWLSRDGRTGARLAGVPAVSAMALSHEADGLVLYSAHPNGASTQIVRHLPFAGEAVVLTEVEGPVHEVRAIDAGHVQIATDRGMLEIQIDLDRIE